LSNRLILIQFNF